MSLDLTKVASQVEGMAARLKADSAERQEHLQNALAVLGDRDADLEQLKRKIASSKTTWLVARLVDGLARHYKAPSIPPQFTIIATDGSHIDVDRHKSTRCYLINIGSAILHYGTSPGAVLDSLPRLYSGDDDLVVIPAGVKGREQPIEGGLLGIKRGVDECHQLAELAAGRDASLVVRTSLEPEALVASTTGTGDNSRDSGSASTSFAAWSSKAIRKGFIMYLATPRVSA